MCGIAGIFALGSDRETPPEPLLRAMAQAMLHRGPDDEGTYAAPGVGLSMRRLSIIDLEGGHQPMASPDGRIVAVLNGEIYNFQALREELERKGHRFRTRSDTEVLVHGYREWGPDLLERLNGMFGLAVYDAQAESLLVARDRLGIKPLYYAEACGRLLFASELKALLADPALERRVDPTALDLYLALGYVPSPHAILKGVRKLLPGHRILATRSGLQVQRWWSLPDECEIEPDPEGPERVRALLAEAVKLRCIADVPLGAFLSGGIDSSAIVALMRATGQDPVRTFSIGFEDPSYDETDYAREVATRFATEHTEERVGADSWKLTSRLARHLDEPFADTSIYPTYRISELARRHVTVVLSGDGGDELFGGYHASRAQQLARRYARVPRTVRRILERGIFAFKPAAQKRGLVNSAQRFVRGMRLPEPLGHMRWMVYVDALQRAALRGPELLDAAPDALGDLVRTVVARAPQLDPMERAMFVDLHMWLPDDILTKVDRMSMACSLEARTPFLDHRLVELVARMPSAARIRGGRTKIVLRKALRNLLPARVLTRPKEGFSIPMKNWLRNELRPEAEAIFDPAHLGRHGFLQPDAVGRLWRRHLDGVENHAHVLFAILMFDHWYAEVVEGTGVGSAQA